MHDGMMGGWNGNGMGGPWSMTGTRLLLADSLGKVVADTLSSTIGTTLMAPDLAAGIPVQANGQRVGTLLAISTQANTNTPAAGFLSAINRSTWLAGWPACWPPEWL